MLVEVFRIRLLVAEVRLGQVDRQVVVVVDLVGTFVLRVVEAVLS